MRIVLCLVFFLSGAAGLIFETLWFRMAGLTFGNSVWASSLVLASFMGGLALGNAISARFGYLLRRPLLTYAAIEVIVGLTGWGLVLAFPYFPELFAPLFRPLLGQLVFLNPLRLGIAFALLLIPTTAMGITLPLMVKALNRNNPGFGRALGQLYGWNTLGAMTGAILGEEILLGLLGIKGTALAAASLNFLAALAALRLRRRYDPARQQKQEDKPRGNTLRRLTSTEWRILAAAFLTGGILLSLEVVWFRFLQLFVPSTHRSFAIMILVVLFGIGAGSLASSLWLRFRPKAYRLYSHLALVAGLLTLWSYILFESIPQRYNGATLGSFTDTLEISAYLMLAVSFLSGLLFTFLGRTFFETCPEETRAVGLVTLANTLGATLGALLAGWALLPRLGIEHSIFLLAVLYFVAGALPRPIKPWRLETATVRTSLAVLLLAYLTSMALYPFGLMKNHFVPIVANRFSEGDASVIDYREGLTETIVFTQKDWMGEPYSKRLITNAYSMSGVDLLPIRYMKYFVYWALAFHPKVEKALLISYGVGSTAKAMTDSTEIEQIDIVDISRDILNANSIVYPDPRELPLNDPRVTVFIEDGRFCLLTSTETYDLITAEPPPLSTAGVINLYTQEYFQLLRNRLNEGGFTTYWLPVGDLSLDDSKSVVKAFCSVFDDCSLWRGAELDLIMIGSKNARGLIERASFERQWRDPKVARELQILGIETPELLLSTFLGDASFLATWAGDQLPLVDDFPHRLSGKEPDFSVYDLLLDNQDAQERYRNSSFLKQRLPPPLFEAGLAQYPYQAIIDYSLNEYFATRRSLQLEELNLILTETNLRTPALWLLGDYTEFSGIIEALVERNVTHEQVELYLGFREMADRNYVAAERHFDRSQVLGGGNINLHYYRILALAYAGDQQQAEQLARELRSKQGPMRNDSRFWEFCANTLGLDTSN